MQSESLGTLHILKSLLFTTFNEVGDVIITIFTNEKTEDQQD